MPRNRDDSEGDLEDDSAARPDGLTASLSDGFRGITAAMNGVFANLNLVGTLSLFIALVSYWLDFRGAYTATTDAIHEFSPVAAGLIPSALVGLTVFVMIWCAVYGWHFVQSARAKLVPDMKTRADLKRLVPDIESCLFFLERASQAIDERDKYRLKGYISESCLSLWEDMQSIGLDGPTVYCIGEALPFHSEDDPNVEELYRILKALTPLARSGKVREARRLY